MASTERVDGAWDLSSQGGVRDYLGRFREVFEEPRLESVDLTSVKGDVVLAVVHIAGTSARFEKVDAVWACRLTPRQPVPRRSPPRSSTSRRHSALLAVDSSRQRFPRRE